MGNLEDDTTVEGDAGEWDARPEGATSFTTLEAKAKLPEQRQGGPCGGGHGGAGPSGRTTQVWDATITNETTDRLMAAYRCTQLMLYPQ